MTTPPATWQAPTWEQIVRDNSVRVYRLAYRLTGNRQDAEDLTQETFVRVFRSLDSFVPGTFEGWLHRITTNLFLDQVRRRRRIRMDATGDETARWEATDELGAPERAYEHANLDHDVQRALSELPPEYRAAVVLCDIEGLSYEEIAVTLGVKLGTVRSRIHRARARLRVSLEHRRPELSMDPDAEMPSENQLADDLLAHDRLADHRLADDVPSEAGLAEDLPAEDLLAADPLVDDPMLVAAASGRRRRGEGRQ